MKTKVSTRVIAGGAMLAALATILQYLQFPIPLMPPFIKFEFSDLPALIGAYAYGPMAGIAIELVKNLLHCAVSQSATVGELANFIVGASFAGVAGAVYAHKKTKKMAFWGGLAGVLAMAIVSVPSNYYIVYPFYYKAYMPEEVVLAAYQKILPSVNSVLESLYIFNMPFTASKGLISLAIAMPIYKKISPILKKQDMPRREDEKNVE